VIRHLKALVVVVLAQVNVVAVVPAAGFLEPVQRQHPRRPKQPVALVLVAHLREEHLPSAVVRLCIGPAVVESSKHCASGSLGAAQSSKEDYVTVRLGAVLHGQL